MLRLQVYLSDYARMKEGEQKERSRTSLSTYGVLFSSTSRGNVVEQPNDMIGIVYVPPTLCPRHGIPEQR